MGTTFGLRWSGTGHRHRHKITNTPYNYGNFSRRIVRRVVLTYVPLPVTLFLLIPYLKKRICFTRKSLQRLIITIIYPRPKTLKTGTPQSLIHLIKSLFPYRHSLRRTLLPRYRSGRCTDRRSQSVKTRFTVTVSRRRRTGIVWCYFSP